MGTYRIEIDEEDFKNKMEIALEGIKIDVVDKLQSKLTQSHGKDTGALSASIPANSKVDGYDLTIGMAEHGKYLEWGTPPHFPPPDKLKGWVQRKWGVSPEEADQYAFLLAKIISERGTRPFPFIRPTFENDVGPIIKKNIIRAFKD